MLYMIRINAKRLLLLIRELNVYPVLSFELCVVLSFLSSVASSLSSHRHLLWALRANLQPSNSEYYSDYCSSYCEIDSGYNCYSCYDDIAG